MAGVHLSGLLLRLYHYPKLIILLSSPRYVPNDHSRSYSTNLSEYQPLLTPRLVRVDGMWTRVGQLVTDGIDKVETDRRLVSSESGIPICDDKYVPTATGTYVMLLLIQCRQTVQEPVFGKRRHTCFGSKIVYSIDQSTPSSSYSHTSCVVVH